MKTILVLGGAGYIGSHTVYELIDNGYDVVVADNLETGFRKAVHPKARFYQGDIRNKEFCDHVFSSEKIDAVIHFAANSQVGESMVNPLKYYDNNLGGTRTMLQSMIEHGVKYIVFSSTAATYGEPERVPILETDPTHPTNCYGETKLSMERMFYWASVAHGIHFVALRYFNACGAHMSGKIGEAHNPETHLIPIVLQVPNGQRDHAGTALRAGRGGVCLQRYAQRTDNPFPLQQCGLRPAQDGTPTGIGLDLIGLAGNTEETGPIAAQSAGTLLGLRLMMTVLPMAVLAAALVLFRRRFTLTDDRAAEISAALHREENQNG